MTCSADCGSFHVWPSPPLNIPLIGIGGVGGRSLFNCLLAVLGHLWFDDPTQLRCLDEFVGVDPTSAQNWRPDFHRRQDDMMFGIGFLIVIHTGGGG